MDTDEPKHIWSDLITKYLGSRSDSIAGIRQALLDGGENVHRLVLTGYLNALVDMGVLHQTVVRPSRIFSTELPSRMDIYAAVGAACAQSDIPEQADAALMTLYFLFERPVFMREIERCQVGFPRNYNSVQSLMRVTYIEKLGEVGVKIPVNNALIEPTEKGPTNILFRALRDLNLKSFELQKFPVYSGRTRQTTLY